MANAKKKKNYRDSIEGMGKREVNALNKEIRAHYTEHGWRKTVSVYKVAPTDLSEIVDPDGKNKAKKAAKKPKAKAKAAAPKKAKAKAAKKAPKKKPPKKKAAAPAKKAKKKPGPKTKAAATKKKTTKRKATKKKATKKTKPAATELDGLVLDWLLNKRTSMSVWDRKEMTLEQVIVDLAAHVRGV